MMLEIPGCTIRFKDDPPETMPWRDRWLHAAARRITPDYDRHFTTVIYPNIYLPTGTRPIFERTPERYYTTFRHEFVHLKDWQRFHLAMAVSYVLLLPVGWTMRAFWELRGYAQNMICAQERYGSVPEATVERIARIFAGRDYVYMLVPYSLARRQVRRLRAAIESGTLSGVYPYGTLDHTPPPPPDYG
ncbi:MAG: hypothetical protein AAFS10_06610 [Myxococcota bacterium]